MIVASTKSLPLRSSIRAIAGQLLRASLFGMYGVLHLAVRQFIARPIALTIAPRSMALTSTLKNAIADCRHRVTLVLQRNHSSAVIAVAVVAVFDALLLFFTERWIGFVALMPSLQFLGFALFSS